MTLRCGQHTPLRCRPPDRDPYRQRARRPALAAIRALADGLRVTLLCCRPSQRLHSRRHAGYALRLFSARDSA